VSDCFLAASVAALAASRDEDALGDGVVAAAPGAGVAGAGAGAAAGGGATTAGGSSFLPHAVSAAAVISEAISTDFFIAWLLWMKVSKKKF
jgi:hypothetical protein